ncbi:NADH-quinone oxidoreductase subunit J [Buchnera aphidicola (Takecallis taiwana)]|uniref:NADH-quinone oxidoreductase subunit J family protein n=1 Tax=Buchnera aphidicola TaxID=9 RepID=UPI0031B6A55B
MYLAFYCLSFLTVLFTVFSIFQKNVMYSLLYFFVSVLTTSIIFFLLGNYLIGSLQIIIYAGAILVLFMFVVMLLNVDELENQLYYPKYSYVFFIFCMIFCIFGLYKMFFCLYGSYVFKIISNMHVLGKMLFEPYILIVEFVSILLLSIIVIIILISNIQNKNILDV